MRPLHDIPLASRSAGLPAVLAARAFRTRSFVHPLTLTLLAALAARAEEARIPIYAGGQITQPGSYVVTRGFTGQIQILSDDVTLELNGQAITGTSSAVYIAGGKRHVTIKNGILLGGTNGILHQALAGTRGVVRIENVTLEGASSVAIFLFGMERAEVVHCTIASAGGQGILANGRDDSFSGVFEGNVIRSTASSGIQVYALTSGQIRNNTISSFGGTAAIHLQGFASANPQGANLIEGNTIGNGGANHSGIVINVDCPGNLVSNNTITTSYYGIEIDSAGNHVAGNTCRNNLQAGIYVLSGGPSNNFIEDNHCTQNATYGISCGPASNRYRDNMLLGNTLGAVVGGGDAGGNITS